MKYLLLLPILIYYIIRDLPTLLEHSELFKGLSLFVLLTLSLIFLTGWVNSFKSETRLRKKLGNKTYDWLEHE